MTIQFKKAERHALKLKVGIDGPSGSGKTDGALSIATAITNGGKVAVADSENESALYYADLYEFDHLPMPNTKPETYREVIKAAVAAGYDALIIDSLSHAWQRVLSDKEQHELNDRKANKWTLWALYGPKFDGLMREIIDAPIHIIATMRSKQAYEQQEKEGRKTIVKLGMAPQVREGSEYEFGLVFSVNQDHRAEATKDRTRLFDPGALLDLRSPELHRSLIGWMNQGGEAPSKDTPLTVAAPVVADRIVKGKRLGDYEKDELTAMQKALREKGDSKHKLLLADISRELTDRVLGPKKEAPKAIDPLDDNARGELVMAASAANADPGFGKPFV